MCVHVCARMCVCVHVFVAHACGGQRSTCMSSSVTLCLIPLGQGLSLAGQLLPSATDAGVTGTHSHDPLFMWVLGI